LPQPLPAAPVSGAESEQRVGNGIFVKADRAIIGSLKPADIMNEIGGQTTGLRLGLAGGADLGNAEAGGAEMEGVGVTSISQGSIFEKIGLQPGDVIQDINGIQPTTPNQMADALHQAISESGGMVRIEVERGDIIEPIYIEIDTTQDET
ncbi:MAG: PDZ domain-containing protein, partial [Sulfitobacter sp.]|nr:PDZ domain-containing protein [Sulfitobacter sp.]